MKIVIRNLAIFALGTFTFIGCNVYKNSNMADNMVMKIITTIEKDTLFIENAETGIMEMSIVDATRIDTVFLFKE